MHETGDGNAHDNSSLARSASKAASGYFVSWSSWQSRLHWFMSSSHRLLNVAIMLFGYNTNGFAHHRLENSLAILAKLGYGSVAITLDQNALNPYAENRQDEVAQVRRFLKKLGLRSVIETGARFLLDPWHKHQPTLISPTAPDRERRLDFLCQAA